MNMRSDTTAQHSMERVKLTSELTRSVSDLVQSGLLV